MLPRRPECSMDMMRRCMLRSVVAKLSANLGSAPMAYRSLTLLAAAIRPKSVGLSTTGVNTSMDCTTAKSSLSRYTAPSSEVSNPTNTLGSETDGSLSRTVARSPGDSFAAHPAVLARVVSRMASCSLMRLRLRAFDYRIRNTNDLLTDGQ